MFRFVKIVSLLCLAVNVSLLVGCATESSPSAGSPSSGGDSVSQSGSTAAMTLHKDAMYSLDSQLLSVFDISETIPKKVAEHQIVGAETLFIYKDYLYVGGQFGVDIWDVSNELAPVQVNFYAHVRGCDPIIVHNDIGYITLRNRPGCGGDTNRLEVVDFSDPEEPVLIGIHPLQYPYGLAKMGDYLAVCQEEYGLNILEVTQTEDVAGQSLLVEEMAEYKEINCFDLIYRDDVLLVTAADGIYQLQVDGFWLTPLSQIPVGDVISEDNTSAGEG